MGQLDGGGLDVAGLLRLVNGQQRGDAGGANGDGGAGAALRVNDERLLGLTGAQFLSVALIAAGGWLLWRVVPNATATPVQEVAA